MKTRKNTDDEITAELDVLEAAERTAPAPSTRTPEAWAEAKGMLPEFRQGGSAFGTSALLNPDSWKFRAAKAFKKWTDGAAITEAEFNAAIAEMEAQTYR
jgi:hypothetical protein